MPPSSGSSKWRPFAWSSCCSSAVSWIRPRRMPWLRRRRCCRRCLLRLFKVNWPLARVRVVGCVVCSRIRPQGSAAGSYVFSARGFSLHAATRIGAEDRSGLERLCR